MTRSAPNVSNDRRGAVAVALFFVFFAAAAAAAAAFDFSDAGTSNATEPYVVITMSIGRASPSLPPPPPPPPRRRRSDIKCHLPPPEQIIRRRDAP